MWLPVQVAMYRRDDHACNLVQDLRLDHIGLAKCRRWLVVSRITH
jgi:hypothetical protein